MDVSTNIQKVGVYTFPLICWMKEKVVTGLRRGKPQQKRTVWEIKYSDGSTVEMLILSSRVLAQGGVDLVGYPEYCPICAELRIHDYYHFDGKVKCRHCGNPEGENDNRPFAKVIAFPSKGNPDEE